MSTFALWRLFHRPGRRGGSGHTSALAIVAFAAATAIFLTVLGGVHGFIWRASADHTLKCLIDRSTCAPGTWAVWAGRLKDQHDWAQYASTYVMLAAFACILLIVPFVALGGAIGGIAAGRAIGGTAPRGRHHQSGDQTDRVGCRRTGAHWRVDRHRRLFRDHAADHAAEFPGSEVHVRAVVGGIPVADRRAGGGHGPGADLRIADAASGRHHPAGRHRSDRPAAAHEVARNRVPGRAGGRDRAVQEPAGPAALR